MSKRLDILKQSLVKKEKLFDQKISQHFDSVRQANGQPLNDKRNGQATTNRWDRQNDALRTIKAGIATTKAAIEKEEYKIAGVEIANEILPKEILALVDSGELIQWKKHPTIFFVPGVDKARIIWDDKRKVVAHRYTNLITDKDQWKIFVKTFNPLGLILNPNES